MCGMRRLGSRGGLSTGVNPAFVLLRAQDQYFEKSRGTGSMLRGQLTQVFDLLVERRLTMNPMFEANADANAPNTKSSPANFSARQSVTPASTRIGSCLARLVSSRLIGCVEPS